MFGNGKKCIVAYVIIYSWRSFTFHSIYNAKLNIFSVKNTHFKQVYFWNHKLFCKRPNKYKIGNRFNIGNAYTCFMIIATISLCGIPVFRWILNNERILTFLGVGARMIRQENRYSIIKQKIQRKNCFGKSS